MQIAKIWYPSMPLIVL